MFGQSKEPFTRSEQIERREWGVLAICGLALIAGMLLFFLYPYPNGAPSIGEFVVFWFRELVILGVIAGAILWGAISRFRSNRRGNGGEHAL